MKVRKLINVLNTDIRIEIIQHKETGYETLFKINFPIFLDSTLLNMKILDFTPMVHYWTQREK